MQLIPTFVRTKIGEAFEWVSDGYRRCERILILHPVLLIPATAIYGFATFLVAVVSILLGIGVAEVIDHYWPIPRDSFGYAAFFFGKIFFVPLAAAVWLHYLYLAFRSFASAAALKGYAGPILRVVQLVGTSVFIFAIAHYYVALFTDDAAYKGLTQPIREGGWAYAGFEDRLSFAPSIDTVLDCIYFSTITTATIGYGDIYPVTRAAKIVTIIQTMFSFGLIAVILGWVIGHAKDEASRSSGVNAESDAAAELLIRRLGRHRSRTQRPAQPRRRVP